MHSRIFQVSMEPIAKYNYIEENDFYDHWFTNEIADYVSDSCDRDHDIDWFKVATAGCEFGEDENGKYFIVKNKARYFADKFDKFKNAAEQLSVATIDEFVDGLSHAMYKLIQAYEDKYGFYIDADGELMTRDEFIRGCATDEKYYFGNTIDYHM